LNLNGILLGSDNTERLVAYYTKLFGAPGWSDGGYTGWQIGTGWLGIGPHSEVHGANSHPGRIIWNIETADVRAEAARLKDAGATVVREAYDMGEGESQGTIATFSDPDSNYFQLVSPM
jgi:predicted enzyme related to lactoylglutathione lyase